MNMNLKLCFVYLVCWLLPLQCGRSRWRETTWCWKSRVDPTVASLCPILSWKLTGELKLVSSKCSFWAFCSTVYPISIPHNPSKVEPDCIKCNCDYKLEAPKYKFSSLYRMVREDENTWAGTLACRRIYVKRVAEDELRHWTTDGYFTLTRWQKKLHPSETLFSELADTQLWPSARQLQRYNSICDQSMWFFVLVNWRVFMHNHLSTECTCNMFLPIIHLIPSIHLQLLWFVQNNVISVYCCHILLYQWLCIICWGFREHGGGRCDRCGPWVYGTWLWSLGDSEQTLSFKDWWETCLAWLGQTATSETTAMPPLCLAPHLPTTGLLTGQ